MKSELIKKSLPVSCWAAEDRPTNKIEYQGVRSMSNAELLSIIIGAGTDCYNQVDIAQMLLADYDSNLTTIASQTVRQLSKSEGIGLATAKRILASLELGKRIFLDKKEKKVINTATNVYNYMYPKIGMIEVEEFWILLLNQHQGLIKEVCVAKGGITETIVDVRVIMKEAILSNATVLVACHNHPSGSINPSKADDDVTRSIKKACDTMRIRFQDHVIIGDGCYYSFHENGKI